MVFLSIPKSFLEKVVEEVEKDLLFSMKSFVKSVKRVDHNTAVFYLPRPGPWPFKGHNLYTTEVKLEKAATLSAEIDSGKDSFFCVYVPSRVLHDVKLQFT